MPKAAEFDLVKAHRYFSVFCFNEAWKYIELPARTTEEDETMLQLSMTSLWHWTQRADCTQGNLSVGYWQISRVHALLGHPDRARQAGLLSLQYSQGEGSLPFHRAYAYEALARAEALAGEHAKKEEYLRLAPSAPDRMNGTRKSRCGSDRIWNPAWKICRGGAERAAAAPD